MSVLSYLQSDNSFWPVFFLPLLILVMTLTVTGCHIISVEQHRAIEVPPNASGEVLFKAHCSKCHSTNPTSNVPKLTRTYASPLNNEIQMASFPREYLTKIISKGGKSVGRSKVMPRWDQVLSDEEIARIIDFLTGKTINVQNKE